MKGVNDMQNLQNVFFFYKRVPELKKEVETLSELFINNHFTIVDNYDEADLIASIGGDNAFLQAVRKTEFQEHCLYVGISPDKTGMYTDFTTNHLSLLFDSIKKDQLEVESYSLLQVNIDDNFPFYCLNECSIRSNVIKALVMEIYIDNMHFETFRGDGIIVSTPTGSTAYNKSVRGAVVDPRLNAFQVSEIASLNNNDFRTLGTSFLLNGDRTLSIKVAHDGNHFPIIGMDNEAMSISHLEEIQLKLANKKIKGLKLKHKSFWNKVKEKFL